MDSKTKQSLLVWDQNEDPQTNQQILLWNGYTEAKNQISIFKVVEQNADELKKEYLKLVYNLGEKRLNGQSVINHLQLRKNFNYWWMTLIVEKCNYSKSTWINDAIRLLALEKIIIKNRVTKISLVTSNKILAKCFRLLCLKHKIEFDCHQRSGIKPSQSFFKQLYGFLPKLLQAIVWFSSYIVSRWKLRGVGLKEWKSTEGRITFISYFFNLLPESLKKGHYDSHYWAHLPNLLMQEDISTNWLHIYVKDSVCPSEKHAAKLIQKFNQTGRGQQTHTTLDTFLGFKVIWNTLLDWVRLFKVGRKIQSLGSIEKDDGGYLWPFMKLDLNESLYGVTALNNLLSFNLFEESLRLLPRQKKGVYLQENQGWEFGLIQAWKATSHGNIIGVPHSTVRFWDLRYFFDSCCYNSQLPMPNQVAVNGNLMRKSYIAGGYQERELVDVEALRYLYLNTERKKNYNYFNSEYFIVLVLGDYLAEHTHFQMRLLEAVFPSFSPNIRLLVKPHPNFPIIPSEYPKIKMEVTMDSISSLLDQCNIVYTSNVTSAAIDAYCANVHVISALNPKTLNMSPLMGVEGVEFVSRVDELVKAIEKIEIEQKNNKKSPEDVFWLDPKLAMWKNLLTGEKNNGDIYA